MGSYPLKGESEMVHNVNELKKLIIEKNTLLKTINSKDNSKEKELVQTQIELDNLLFHYFKALRTTCYS